MVTWAFTADGLAFWRGGEQIALVPLDSLPALIVPVIATLSVALCAALWGEVRPVCARAWRMRDVPFWGRYIACVDRLAAWYEPGHCERSAGRWG